MDDNVRLYRGKRKDNGQWIVGYYCKCCFGRFPCDPAIIEDVPGRWEPVEVISETVGQCIGIIPDKHGKQIFDGDIVRLDEYIKSTFDVRDGVVKYGWGGFHVGGFSTLNSINALANHDGILRGEVIGNIHDNPELIEGDNK